MTTERTAARLIEDCEARYGRPLPALRSYMADMLDDVHAARVASLRAAPCASPCVRNFLYERCIYPHCR